MKHKKTLITLLLSLMLLFFLPTSALAKKKDKVAALAKKLARLELKLKRKLAKKKAKIKKASQVLLNKGLSDSDGDGLPDAVEGAAGGDACKADSDGDGVSDGDEVEHGGDVSDDSDGEEIEGIIESISDDSITVNSTTFVITSDTELIDEEKNSLEISDFSAGDCVEVEGITKDDTL
ncbi:MAG: hypothetical protein D6780_04110, partial [Candidatus Dadabacteria bacterium]